jgi:hypothetical protein
VIPVKACPGCSVWIPDDAGFCPSCGKALGPAAPPPAGASPPSSPPAPPSSTPSPPSPGPEPAPAFGRAKAESRVRGLGLIYIVAGGLVVLFEGFGLANLLTGRTLEQALELREQPPFKGNPDLERAAEIWIEWLGRSGLPAVPYVLGMLLGAFYLWSGLRLRDLRGRGMAIAAAIAMIVLFPFNAECCACCLSFPVGIAALFILTRADTESIMR